MELNLGAGKKLIKNTVNVDVMPWEGIDQIVDLSIFPWPWKDESINAIYAYHIIEHFFGQKQFIEECLRILKKGALLHIIAPHSSYIPSIGCIGHYRTYSYDTFKQYLSVSCDMFKEPKFETIYQNLRWWYTVTGDNVPKWMMFFIMPLNHIINFFIALSPHMFENWWWPIVGGAREVEWIGRKL